MSSTTQKPPAKPRLGDKWLEFVGEGAANTVWALHFTDDTGGDAYTQELHGFLLRIQKHTKGGDSAISARDQLAYFQDTIVPAFDSDASVFVQQKLVQVAQPLIDECNALLGEMDENHAGREADRGPPHPHLPARARKFAASRVGPAGAHMLTQDMRARARRPAERFAEIKPKWLAQSPTAPRGAVACRNCAVAASRWHAAPEGKKPDKSDPDRYGCPLRLVAPGAERPTPSAWGAHAERVFRGETPRVARFLFAEVRRGPLLRRLRDLQARFARRDTFLRTTPEAPDEDLLVAMTLRDCSVFFRYEDRPDGTLRLLDCTLADLDKKTPVKIPSWQATERELIDGGWYEGKGGAAMPDCYLREAARKKGERGTEPPSAVS